MTERETELQIHFTGVQYEIYVLEETYSVNYDKEKQLLSNGWKKVLHELHTRHYSDVIKLVSLFLNSRRMTQHCKMVRMELVTQLKEGQGEGAWSSTLYALDEDEDELALYDDQYLQELIMLQSVLYHHHSELIDEQADDIMTE
jgi:hypothetical protein